MNLPTTGLDPGKQVRVSICPGRKSSALVSFHILFTVSLFLWGWHLCYIIHFPNEIGREGPSGSEDLFYVIFHFLWNI